MYVQMPLFATVIYGVYVSKSLQLHTKERKLFLLGHRQPSRLVSESLEVDLTS